jgi:hypothetical protein
MTAISALASLPADDREALLLVTWDGLTTDQAAAVLGCRPAACARVHISCPLLSARTASSTWDAHTPRALRQRGSLRM